MIDWLGQNQGLLTLIFSCIVAVSTVVYAFLTYKLVTETRQLRLAQLQPHVSVRVESTPNVFGFTDLIVENVGLGPAYQVRFSVERDMDLDGRNLSDIGFIKHGTDYLAPKQRLSSFFYQLLHHGDVEAPDRPRATLSVRYRDTIGKDYTERFEIDLANFANTSRVGTPPLEVIAKSIEKIQKDIDSLASGRDRIKVVRYTQEDLERERSEMLLRYKQAGAPRPPGAQADGGPAKPS